MSPFSPWQRLVLAELQGNSVFHKQAHIVLLIPAQAKDMITLSPVEKISHMPKLHRRLGGNLLSDKKWLSYEVLTTFFTIHTGESN